METAVALRPDRMSESGADREPRATAHASVLVAEVLAGLAPAAQGLIVDATAGAGGHAAAMLTAWPAARILALDRDPAAVELARERLAPFGSRVRVRLANFRELGAALQEAGAEPPAACLFDLGVSDMQLADPARGFGLRTAGALDMRMGPDAPRSVADLLRTTDEHELADLIYLYGEERHSRRIARRLMAHRAELATAADLARVVAAAVPGAGRERIHPATRTFQALRIAVNDELGALQAVLPAALDALAPGGRLAVISFHSLEDRIVKRFVQRESRDCLCPPEVAVCACGHRRRLVAVTRRPVTAGPEEAAASPKARGAKLRVAEKL